MVKKIGMALSLEPTTGDINVDKTCGMERMASILMQVGFYIGGTKVKDTSTSTMNITLLQWNGMQR